MRKSLPRWPFPGLQNRERTADLYSSPDRFSRNGVLLQYFPRPGGIFYFYSPAAVDLTTGGGGSSSSCPAGIPSEVAATSSSRSSSASASCCSARSIISEVVLRESPSAAGTALVAPCASRDAVPSAIAISPSRKSSDEVGATPSSLPSASRAKASNSFKLGSSSKSLNPNRIKNSFDVLYRIGRPITSLRPAVVIKCLSSSVPITPAVLTPRISEISGEVTGCL